MHNTTHFKTDDNTHVEKQRLPTAIKLISVKSSSTSVSSRHKI